MAANQDYQRELEDRCRGCLFVCLFVCGTSSRCLGRVVGRLEAARRGEEGRSAEATSYLLGGSFNRLELDWRDSHSAYLSHRAARYLGQPTYLPTYPPTYLPGMIF